MSSVLLVLKVRLKLLASGLPRLSFKVPKEPIVSELTV